MILKESKSKQGRVQSKQEAILLHPHPKQHQQKVLVRICSQGEQEERRLLHPRVRVLLRQRQGRRAMAAARK